MAWNANKLVLALGGALILLAIVVNLLIDPATLGLAAPLFPGLIAVAVLMFWERRWLYLVAGILAAAFPLLVVFAFGALGAITHPGGGAETVVVAMLLVGGILTLLGGIMGFVQGGKERAQPAVSLRAGQVVAALVIVSMLAGFGTANAFVTEWLKASNENPVSHAESVDERIRLVAGGYAFAPREIRLGAGNLTALDIENRDRVFHTFAYHLADGTHEVPLYPGQTTTVLLKFDEAQTIHVWCAPHSGGAEDRSNESMTASIVVA